MTTKPDPKAEKIRTRKERKAANPLRQALRESGIAGMVTLYLTTAKSLAQPIDEDCPVCKARRERTAKRALRAVA